jgi:hypothetical protein
MEEAHMRAVEFIETQRIPRSYHSSEQYTPSDDWENDAGFPHSLLDHLEQRNYKFLGGGVDQMAFLEPGTGYVLKIFTANDNDTHLQHSLAQKTILAFINYCHANPHNEFLPSFTGWERFEWENQHYLQIRMERLFEFGRNRVTSALMSMAIWAKEPGATFDHFIKELDIGGQGDGSSDELLVADIGMEGLRELWKTIKELNAIAVRGRFKLDLHGGNFMLGSDGHIVISDPFFVGWDKRGT